MTDSNPAGPPASNQRKFGILLIALGVLFVILDLVVFALVGEPWVLIALIVAIPNFYRGIRTLREARDAEGRG
jgi:hypothetical protein